VQERRARATRSLDSRDPVARLRQIGTVRAGVLARHDVYSVGDFIERTSDGAQLGALADALDMAQEDLLDLRDEAAARLLVQTRKSATGGSGVLARALGVLISSAGVASILLATYVVGAPTRQSRFSTYPVVIFQEDYEPIRSWGPWRLEATSVLGTRGRTRTQLKITTNSDWEYTGGFPRHVPEAVAFYFLNPSETLVDASARSIRLRQREVQLEGGLLTTELREAGEDIHQLTVEHLPPIENISSDVLVIRFEDPPDFPPLPRRHLRRFEFVAIFEDEGFDGWLDPLRSGSLFVHYVLTLEEVRNVRIEKEVFAGFEKPGLYLHADPVEYSGFDLNATWKPEIGGQFLAPEDLIGAVQFADFGHGQAIRGSFTYGLHGWQGLAYLVSILGLSAIVLGVDIVKGKFATRVRNLSTSSRKRARSNTNRSR